jgi:hypothetical protein
MLRETPPLENYFEGFATELFKAAADKKRL